MGKKSKKKAKKRRRILKAERSKVSRFFDKATSKLFIISSLSVIPFLVFNTLFAFDISISIEFYFTIIYGVSVIVAMFFSFGLVNSFYLDGIWNQKNFKDSVFIWFGRALFLGILIINLKHYVVPMSLDFPRIVTGGYEEISGTVKNLEYDYPSGSSRYRWNEKIQYVYFKEHETGKILKIAFRANSSQIMYGTKKIYYLPFTKWGIRAQ